MTALAGVLRLDGAPVEAAELERVFAPARHRGPDHVGRYLDAGGFGLVVGVMATTPEDVGRAQPVVAAGACLGFDGRLDNRDELRARLGPPPGDGESDAELALRAFGAWGDAFLGELVGDFALALWESAPRRLVLARDVFGQRALVYHLGARHLVLGTEVAQVIAHPAVPVRPDLSTVAGYLSGALHDPVATSYAGVRRVPAGHALEVVGGRARARPFWRFDGARRVHARDDEAYAARLRDALTVAVRAQLRAVGPVASHLSGGLDSSAITAIAAEASGGGGVTAASLVFPGEACDETPYIDAVVAHLRIPSVRVAPLAIEPEDPRDQARRYRDLPDYPNTAMHAPLDLELRARGARVVLTGEGGDELWAGGFTHAADLLAAGRPLAAFRRAWWDGRVTSFTQVRWGALRHLLGPFVPRAVRALRPRRPDSLLGPALAGAAAAPAPQSPPLDHGTHAQREALADLGGAWAMHGNESGDRFLARLGLESRAPFMDRRLVELALAFPEEQKRVRAVPKAVLRRALGDRLPAPVRERLTKATFDAPYTAALTRWIDRLTRPAVCDEGWVDRAALAARIAQWRRDPARGGGRLWMVFAVETWLDQVFRASSGD